MRMRRWRGGHLQQVDAGDRSTSASGLVRGVSGRLAVRAADARRPAESGNSAAGPPPVARGGSRSRRWCSSMEAQAPAKPTLVRSRKAGGAGAPETVMVRCRRPESRRMIRAPKHHSSAATADPVRASKSLIRAGPARRRRTTSMVANSKPVGVGHRFRSNAADRVARGMHQLPAPSRPPHGLPPGPRRRGANGAGEGRRTRLRNARHNRGDALSVCRACRAYRRTRPVPVHRGRQALKTFRSRSWTRVASVPCWLRRTSRVASRRYDRISSF